LASIFSFHAATLRLCDAAISESVGDMGKTFYLFNILQVLNIITPGKYQGNFFCLAPKLLLPPRLQGTKEHQDNYFLPDP
jgi:hypothetical protein